MLANRILGTQITCHYPESDLSEWKYTGTACLVQCYSHSGMLWHCWLITQTQENCSSFQFLILNKNKHYQLNQHCYTVHFMVRNLILPMMINKYYCLCLSKLNHRTSVLPSKTTWMPSVSSRICSISDFINGVLGYIVSISIQ